MLCFWVFCTLFWNLELWQKVLKISERLKSIFFSGIKSHLVLPHASKISTFSFWRVSFKKIMVWSLDNSVFRIQHIAGDLLLKYYTEFSHFKVLFFFFWPWLTSLNTVNSRGAPWLQIWYRLSLILSFMTLPLKYTFRNKPNKHELVELDFWLGWSSEFQHVFSFERWL